MVSSLLHVLIVTPAIFSWLRERQLGLGPDTVEVSPAVRRPRVGVWALVVLGVAGAVLAGWLLRSRGPVEGRPDAVPVVQVVKAGDIEVVLRAPGGALTQGRNRFVLEFRRAGGGTALVDVGQARASASMTMPGMSMSGGLDVQRTNVPGHYAVTGEFGMAGAWQWVIEWDGPAGKGSATFEGGVQ